MKLINALISLFLVVNSSVSRAVIITMQVVGDEVEVVNVRDDNATYIYHPNGILEISDNYPTLNGVNIVDSGSTDGYFQRNTSLFSFLVGGDRYGHTFPLQGKLLNTKISYPVLAEYPAGYYPSRPPVNNGCEFFTPEAVTTLISIIPGDPFNFFKDCSGQSIGRGHRTPASDRNAYILSTLEPRRFNLNLSGLFNNPKFKNAPPDFYYGEGYWNLERFVHTNNGGGERNFGLYVQLQLEKRPFFRGVRLGQRQLPFDISYNTPQGAVGVTATDLFFEGQISPHNTIDVQLSSINRFSLAQERGDATIPYQANLRFNGQLLPLNHRQAAQPQILTGWNSVEGVPARLEFSFNQPNHTLVGGSYQDTLTLMANLSLN